MTANLLTVVASRFSWERLAPYQVAASGDLDGAVALYEWNGEVASAWWSVIGNLEVLVRNAVHEQLTQWSQSEFGEPRWYLDPGRCLSPEGTRAIAAARRQTTREGRPETPGRVVAELSFGFWRFLLAARYERVLWLPTLRYAFPHLIGRGLRNQAHESLKRLQGLRNRIAHHEPIHNRPLRLLHQDALSVAGWICPVTESWIEARSRVPELLEVRPGKWS